MTTWTDIFERAADYDVDTAAVRASLADRRSDDADTGGGDNDDE